MIQWIKLLILGIVLVCTTESRRVRVRNEPDESEQTVEYYAAEPQEDNQRVVLVSAADQYNGLYGQPTASSRTSQQDEYIPSSRHKPSYIPRAKEPTKSPPVQTIRNYNKVNDDGSFTFGYEAADGSFKEETRGTDCVVRGKYGYVDPDGNKREFTYVSGNPCDPNAPKDEHDEVAEQEANEPDNGPANYPTRPVVRPIQSIHHVTQAPKPAITLFQNNYEQGEDEQPEPEQVLRQHPIRRPNYISRPQYLQQSQEAQIYQRPQLISPSTTPAPLVYRQSIAPVSITPRPVTASTISKPQLPATTYRPQLVQVSVTPRPSVLYTKHLVPSPSTTPAAFKGNIDFDAEFQKFQQENNIVSPTPSSLIKTTPKIVKTASKSAGGAGQIYSSALIFDPASGQYKTQLYQTLPQTQGDFTLNQRIQPYVHQPQRQVVNIQQLQQQSPLYTQHLRPQVNPQATYQQQQSEAQFLSSAQLYAQQQKIRATQQQKQQPQPVYYIQPSVDQSAALGAGQIESFLRGHNIQF